MADQPLNAAIGDALLHLLARAWCRLEPRLERWAERVADVLRPEPPLFLQSLDGEVVTGVVVLDRGQAILCFGVRQGRDARPRPPGEYFDDESFWSRGYRR